MRNTFPYCVKAVALGALMLSVAACGNDKQATRGVDTIKELAGLAKNRLTGSEETAAVAAPDPVVMIANVLAGTPNAPLQFVLLERTGAFAVASIYGTNGSNVTWISPDRKTLTLDRGMLVATRGFASDLMSVEDGGAAGLISSRRAGAVEKTYRFLNRENIINRLIMSCRIERGQSDIVSSGEISTQTVLMTEECESPGGFKIKNSYWVDSSGRTVQSVQWISNLVGKVVFRRLRY